MISSNVGCGRPFHICTGLKGEHGFGHRKLMRWCGKTGWRFVLRLKADSVVILPDGSRHRLDAWRPERQHLIHTEGTLLADGARRTELDPHDTRGLSYFQIDCRHFQRLLSQGRRLRLRLSLPAKPDPDPVSTYGVPLRLFGRFTWLPASHPAGC